MSNDSFSKFKIMLRSNGHFVTKTRMSMFGHLQQHPALSSNKLVSLVAKHHRASVYRNIDLFERLGIITKIRLGWNTKLELSDIFKHHHHHFTCLNCGNVIDLPEDPVIEDQIKCLAQINNVQITDHQLELRGYCQNCRN